MDMFNSGSMYQECIEQKETIDGLEIGEGSTVSSTLAAIQDIVKSSGHPQLLKREFKRVGQEYDVSPQDTFRLMQFNILAQGLSFGSYKFVQCPRDALIWNSRRVRLIEEILTVNPDVLCMQEVDHFGLFNTLLTPLGYKGAFIPKPDSPALIAHDTNGPDGCAIFYKQEKFDEVKHESIGLKDGHFTTNQVSIIYTLSVKASGKVVTIVTTHLKARVGYEELRRTQGSYLLDYIRKHYKANPVVVCGDFNGHPEEPVYREFASSRLGLKSAYTAESGKEAKYTYWAIVGRKGKVSELCCTLDYIWYQKDKMAVCGLRSIPTEEEIGPDRLPNFQYPSDHLSIAADLILL